MPTNLSYGKQAPLFSLPADSGQIVAPEDFRGTNMAVYFYPKGDTREAMDYLEQLDRIAKCDAAVIGVSADTPTDHQKNT